MAKGHSLGGGCVVILLNAKAVNAVRCQESTQNRKSSQAAAVCGESRMHGHNGGDGKTQFGCASCPYPLTAYWQPSSNPVGWKGVGIVRHEAY
jgi:hypothetical protein